MRCERNIPSKEYFINLLTKDVDVDDAICELINNAINRYNLQSEGLQLTEYWISIKIINNLIQVWDNCGAVEDVELFKEKLKFNETKENYDDSLIKALLKCGDSIELELNNNAESYIIKINSQTSIDSWEITDQQSFSSDKPKGMRVVIKNIYKEVKSRLETATFMSRLSNKIASKYRYLLDDNIKIKIMYKSADAKFIEPKFIEKADLIKSESKLIEELEVKVKLYKCYQDKNNGWDIFVNDICRLERDKSNITNWSKLRIDGHSFLRFRGEVFIYCKKPSSIVINSIRNILDSNTEIFNLIKEFMYSVVNDNKSKFKKKYVYIQYEKPEEEVDMLKEFFKEEVDKYKEITAKIIGEESFALALIEYQKETKNNS